MQMRQSQLTCTCFAFLMFVSLLPSEHVPGNRTRQWTGGGGLRHSPVSCACACPCLSSYLQWKHFEPYIWFLLPFLLLTTTTTINCLQHACAIIQSVYDRTRTRRTPPCFCGMAIVRLVVAPLLSKLPVTSNMAAWQQHGSRA